MELQVIRNIKHPEQYLSHPINEPIPPGWRVVGFPVPNLNQQPSDLTFSDLIKEILEELKVADTKHGPMLDPEEGWHTLMCEMQELHREMRRRNKDYEAFRKEMLQVAAMGLKLLRDCSDRDHFAMLLCGCAK